MSRKPQTKARRSAKAALEAPGAPRRRGGNYRNNELAARVLAEAAFYGGGVRVAEKYGIARSTYFDWQNALEKDEQLGLLYLRALNDLARLEWANDLNASLRRTLEAITATIESLERTPDNLKVMLEAAQKLMDWEMNRVVAEIESKRALEERLGEGPYGVSEPHTERHQA